MSHQPYESWLLSEEPLMPDQIRVLHDHLETCASCRQLSVAWEELKSLLQDAPVEKPVTGFTERWQARVASLSVEENYWKQRRMSWWFFSLTAGASIFVLIALGIYYFTSIQSPIQFFISGVTLFAGLLALVSAFQVAFIPFIEVLMVSIPPFWWLIFAFGFSSLLLIWTFSLRRIIFPRRVSL
jgi:predicted anti-sigma-YlaC factor YlaD